MPSPWGLFKFAYRLFKFVSQSHTHLVLWNFRINPYTFPYLLSAATSLLKLLLMYDLYITMRSISNGWCRPTCFMYSFSVFVTTKIFFSGFVGMHGSRPNARLWYTSPFVTEGWLLFTIYICIPNSFPDMTVLEVDEFVWCSFGFFFMYL